MLRAASALVLLMVAGAIGAYLNHKEQVYKREHAVELAEKEHQEALEAQRKAFSELSTHMADLVKKADISAGAVYVEFCPMANGGEGAHWLANEKQINNPYFGDKMLRCGKGKETIK